MYNGTIESSLVGRKIISATFDKTTDRITFETDVGVVVWASDGDCCSRSWIEAVDFALLSGEVFAVEEVPLPPSWYAAHPEQNRGRGVPLALRCEHQDRGRHRHHRLPQRIQRLLRWQLVRGVPVKKFWILWNPASIQPPQVRFDSRRQAVEIAKEMQRRHGGEFFVCEAITVTKVVTDQLR